MRKMNTKKYVERAIVYLILSSAMTVILKMMMVAMRTVKLRSIGFVKAEMKISLILVNI